MSTTPTKTNNSQNDDTGLFEDVWDESDNKKSLNENNVIDTETNTTIDSSSLGGRTDKEWDETLNIYEEYKPKQKSEPKLQSKLQSNKNSISNEQKKKKKKKTKGKGKEKIEKNEHKTNNNYDYDYDEDYDQEYDDTYDSYYS